MLMRKEKSSYIFTSEIPYSKKTLIIYNLHQQYTPAFTAGLNNIITFQPVESENMGVCFYQDSMAKKHHHFLAVVYRPCFFN